MIWERDHKERERERESERKKEFSKTKRTQVFFLFKNLGNLVGSYELEINVLGHM